MTEPRTLFITGIHRGLGKATAFLAVRKGFRVVGTVRTEEDMIDVAQWQQDLTEEGAPGTLQGALLDVTDVDGMPGPTRLALQNADILINNAGWGADLATQGAASVPGMDHELFQRALLINAEAPRQLMAIALPHMQAQGWGRVVNVSSTMGKLAPVRGEGAPAYRLSKLLLNGITAIAGSENRGSGVLINSLCPGWCQTDMGGPQATDTPEQGAKRIMHLAQLPSDGPTGAFFIDGVVVSF